MLCAPKMDLAKLSQGYVLSLPSSPTVQTILVLSFLIPVKGDLYSCLGAAKTKDNQPGALDRETHSQVWRLKSQIKVLTGPCLL